jgi:hypothetical protein
MADVVLHGSTFYGAPNQQTWVWTVADGVYKWQALEGPGDWSSEVALESPEQLRTYGGEFPMGGGNLTYYCSPGERLGTFTYYQPLGQNPGGVSYTNKNINPGLGTWGGRGVKPSSNDGQPPFGIAQARWIADVLRGGKLWCSSGQLEYLAPPPPPPVPPPPPPPPPPGPPPPPPTLDAWTPRRARIAQERAWRGGGLRLDLPSLAEPRDPWNNTGPAP